MKRMLAIFLILANTLYFAEAQGRRDFDQKPRNKGKKSLQERKKVKRKSQENKFKRAKKKVQDRYIIVLNEDVSADQFADLIQTVGIKLKGKVERRFQRVLKGMAVKLTEQQAIALSQDPRVKYVEEDSHVEKKEIQSNAPWALDRIDQRSLPFDTKYNYGASGSGVNVYVIDTGIKSAHTEFEGRVRQGYTTVQDGKGTEDCDGHGTHVAGTIAGKTYGVAKRAALYPVRVLDCEGASYASDVIEGIEWVTSNHRKPAVVNMSLGAEGGSVSLDNAVKNSIAAGIIHVTAAGNAGVDACEDSPGRVDAVLTVGATNKQDGRTSFSNYGQCVDIFAPGNNILSAGIASNTATETMSGTSMASPIAAGVAALYLERNPGAIPQIVIDAIINNSTTGKVTSAGSGSPTDLLYAGFIAAAPADTAPPAVRITAPANGSTISGAVTVTADASDPSGITAVEFFVNGNSIGSDSTAPYSLSWNTAGTQNGSVSITVTATDRVGNAGSSAAVTANVNNQTTSTCASSRQLMLNPGFESGTTGWRSSSGVIDASFEYAPKSGQRKAWMNGYGTTHTDTLSQAITIPAGACSATLSFYLWVDTAEATSTEVLDRLRVQVLDSSGAVIRNLGSFSNLDWDDTYVERRFNLMEFKGRSIQIRFLGREDSIEPTSFILDDITVKITE